MGMPQEQAALQQRVEKAAAIYTPFTLTFYDWWVYSVAVRIMQCPPQEFFTFYELNVSEHHLDIGVGSGSFLKHCLRQNLLERVALMDLNPTCLDVTEKALRPLPVKKYQADMLKPFPMQGERFLSVGLNFLLHCVPGSIREKGVVFEQIKQVLAPDGLVFGSTAIYQPGARFIATRFLFDRYNQMGAFNNREDTQEDLQQVLGNLFEHVELVREGAVVFFRASDAPLD